MKGTIINQVKYTEYQTGDKEPTLEEAQNQIGGLVEMLELKNGGCLLFDEEALIKKPIPNINKKVFQNFNINIYGHCIYLPKEIRKDW